VIRGFVGPEAKERAEALLRTAQAAMPARSRLSFDGQHDFNGEDNWGRHIMDAPISDRDSIVTRDDCHAWRSDYDLLCKEIDGYYISARQKLLPNEEAQKPAKYITVPNFGRMAKSLEGKRLSLALHRFSSVLDAHYDIAVQQYKNSRSEVLQAFWHQKRH
jgi:hypothetical protein